MKLVFGTAGVIAMAVLATACTNGQTSNRATLSNGAQMFAVTESVRSELRQQGLDPDEEVCKTEDQIGSVIPKRTCATRAMWAAKAEASQNYAADVQRDALRTRDPLNNGG